MRASYESVMSENAGEGPRVLFLALTVDVGAFQDDSTHVIELVSNLRRLGCRVRWIARQSGDREMWPDPFFHRLSRIPMRRSKLLRPLQNLTSAVRGAFHVFRYCRGSDVIYSRGRLSLTAALLAAKLTRKPIIYEVNGPTTGQLEMYGAGLMNRLSVRLLEKIDKVAFRGVRRIVCSTDAVRDFHCDRHPEFEGKFLTVNNGVNTALFYPLPINDEIAELRRRLGLDEGDEIVVNVGSLSPLQGIECLVRSAPLVLKENPTVKFVIVGSGPTYKQSLRLAKELGVGDRFRFVGQIPYSSLSYYISVADVCVAPCANDIPNCPTEIYEYLACGKPVVCSNIPGVDSLRPTGALTLFEPCNPEALATALLKTLGDMNFRAAQRKLGPSVASEYTWENTARNISEVIETSLDEIETG